MSRREESGSRPRASLPTTCSTPPRGSLPAGWPSRVGTQSNWQRLRAPVFSPRRRQQSPARASPQAMAESQSSSEAPLSACTSFTKCAARAGSHFALLGGTWRSGCARSKGENDRCRRSVDVGLRREADEAFRLLRLARSRRDTACGQNFAREMCLDFFLVMRPGCAYARNTLPARRVAGARTRTHARTHARTHTHIYSHTHTGFDFYYN